GRGTGTRQQGPSPKNSGRLSNGISRRIRMRSDFANGKQLLAAAEDIAEELLRKHDIEKAPVPIEKIVTSQTATVEFVPMVSDGSISWRGKNPRIRVNSRNGEIRRRFTLAHELGHLVWKERYGSTEASARGENTDAVCEGTSLEERFCNAFAARLLVPAQEVEWLADWVSVSISAIEDSVRRMGVSFQT